jgi:holo-[acyl-carrier protein] synthase
MCWPGTGRASAVEQPFLVIGVGVDLVDIDRFRGVLARRPAMAQRLFTEAELGYALAARDAVPRMAVRFAAKEAVMKALGVGLGAFGWHDVEVVREPSGAPGLRVGGAAATLAAERGVGRWHLTLSHSSLVAVAVAVADVPS